MPGLLQKPPSTVSFITAKTAIPWKCLHRNTSSQDNLIMPRYCVLCLSSLLILWTKKDEGENVETENMEGFLDTQKILESLKMAFYWHANWYAKVYFFIPTIHHIKPFFFLLTRNIYLSDITTEHLCSSYISESHNSFGLTVGPIFIGSYMRVLPCTKNYLGIT